jgi:hypothetical protein
MSFFENSPLTTNATIHFANGGSLDHKQMGLIFLFGCAGSLAPEVVRLYHLRTKGSAKDFSLFYILISIFYSLLGGCVAFILPAMNFYAAFYAGVSAPIMITTAVKGKLSAPPVNDDEESNHPIANAHFIQKNRRASSFLELIRDHANGL